MSGEKKIEFYAENGVKLPEMKFGPPNQVIAPKEKLPGKRRGRESKLTEKVKQDIMEAIACGFDSNAKLATYLDLGVSTVSLYLSKMRKEGFDIPRRRRSKSSADTTEPKPTEPKPYAKTETNVKVPKEELTFVVNGFKITISK